MPSTRERIQARRALATGTGLVVASVLIGQALARGGIRSMAVLALSMLALVVPIGHVVLGGRLRGFVFVELPVLLMLTSTLVFRRRTGAALSDNPLDSAAQLRFLWVSLALGLAVAALLSTPLRRDGPRWGMPLPVRLLAAYAVVAALGAVLSVNPILTSYRIVEIGTAVAAVAGAYWMVGSEATRRLEAAVFWFLAMQVLLVWVWVPIFPGAALQKVDAPLPIQLHGIMPALAANSLGARGLFLAVWSFARLVAQRRAGLRSRSALPFTILGVATLVLSQYRTGYAALLAGFAVVLGLRRPAVFWACILAVVTLLVWMPDTFGSAQNFALRGESFDEARDLTGRLEWWSAALEHWKDSPVIGKGLLTASRFEVFSSGTTIFGIHSTWVESLIGTGAVGFACLASAFLVSVERARRAARRPGGPIVPLALLAALGVRSFTGNTFESFGLEMMILLAIATSFPDRRRSVPRSLPVVTADRADADHSGTCSPASRVRRNARTAGTSLRASHTGRVT